MTYHRHIPETNNRAGLIAMAAIFSTTSISVVVLRFYARRLSGLKFKVDDWLALTALVFVLGLNSLFIAATVQHAITGHSPVLDDFPVSTPLEHLVEKYKYGFQTTEKITFGLIKLSILFLWKRMFGPLRSFRIFCWIMIGVVIAWSVAFFFATVFQCGVDWYLNWAPILAFLTQCSNTLNMLTVFAATDIITDVIIIGMPVPMIWRLKMSKERKAAITAVFIVGIFTVGAGIARMYIYLTTSYDKEDNPDFIADFTNFILWSDIEANVAMLCACLPTLFPVATKVKSLSSSSSSRNLLSLRTWTGRKSSHRGPTKDSESLGSDTIDESYNTYLKDSAAPSQQHQNHDEYALSTMITSDGVNYRENGRLATGITVKKEISYQNI